MSDVNEIVKDAKKSWNWLGFLFAPVYYAGYGDMKKGIIFAVIGGIHITFALIVAIFAAINAKKDLPVGEQEFNWKNAGILIAIVLFVNMFFASVFGDSRPVSIVKDGALKNCPTATVEEMVDSFMGSPSWESGIAKSGKNFVNFVNVRGKITLGKKEVDAVVQFIVNKSGTFQYKAFEINGVPQNVFKANILLKKMCNSTK